MDAIGSPNLLQRRLAGRQQPLRRQPAPVRLAARRPDPGPRPHRPAADRRRQPAGLPRQRAHRAADQGFAARDRGPGRTGRRRRPPPLGDRARVRTRRDQARRRRLAAALAAATSSSPRGSRTGDALARQASGVDALRRLVEAHPPEATEARTGIPAAQARELALRSGRRGRRRGLWSHRLVPGAPRDARLVPARRAQRRHRQPRPRAARSSAPARSSSRICCTGSAPTATASSTRGSAAFPTCSVSSRRR